MTAITIRKSSTGQYYGFCCLGHAGFRKSGEDIVCASISILVINTLNAMEQLAGAKLRVTTNEAAGLIDCSFDTEPNDKSVLLMDALVLGLTEIGKEYGKKYIQLKFEEV